MFECFMVSLFDCLFDCLFVCLFVCSPIQSYYNMSHMYIDSVIVDVYIYMTDYICIIYYTHLSTNIQSRYTAVPPSDAALDTLQQAGDLRGIPLASDPKKSSCCFLKDCQPLSWRYH